MPDKNKKYRESFFSRSELRGLILLIIIVSGITFYHIYSNRKDNQQIVIRELTHSKLEHNIKKSNLISLTPPNKQSVKYNFDPNTVNLNQLLELGFSSFTANNILKYRNQGGYFKQNEELKKVYGVTPQFYDEILPYINIIAKPNNSVSSNKTITLKLTDINSADSIELLPIKGIGIKFASRIIKYRNKLGGFYSTDQFKEIYGLSDSIIITLTSNVYIDTSKIKKININKLINNSTFYHPYLSKFDIKSIIIYQKKMGAITSKNQLLEYSILNDETYRKVAPYLTIN